MKKKRTKKPLKMTSKEWAEFRARADADIEKTAKTDPDTVLLSDAELKKVKPVYKRTSREVAVSVGQDVLEWLEKNRFSSNVLIPNLLKAFVDSHQHK